MHATSPITVAMIADKKAIVNVFESAFKIAALWNNDRYHFVVKPPHLARVLLWLKERTMSVAIGAYKKMNIKKI